MQFQVRNELLSRALQALPTSTDVLDRITLSAHDSQLTIAYRGRELDLRAQLPAEVDEAGEATLPAQLLARSAPTIAGEHVRVRLDGTRLVVRSEQQRLTLPLVEDAVDVSHLPHQLDGRPVDRKQMVGLLRPTLPVMVSPMAAARQFRSCFLYGDGRELVACATDSHRIVSSRASYPSPIPPVSIDRARVQSTLNALRAVDADQFQLALHGSNLYWQIDGKTGLRITLGYTVSHADENESFWSSIQRYLAIQPDDVVEIPDHVLRSALTRVLRAASADNTIEDWTTQYVLVYSLDEQLLLGTVGRHSYCYAESVPCIGSAGLDLVVNLRYLQQSITTGLCQLARVDVPHGQALFVRCLQPDPSVSVASIIMPFSREVSSIVKQQVLSALQLEVEPVA